MISTVTRAKARRGKSWLFFALLLALVAAYPIWRSTPELVMDMLQAGSPAYALQEHRNRIKFDSET